MQSHRTFIEKLIRFNRISLIAYQGCIMLFAILPGGEKVILKQMLILEETW